jgi:hypothetical protein
MNTCERLWHPWLHIERLTRIAVAARLRLLNDESDRALAAVLVRRHEIERAGWFN